MKRILVLLALFASATVARAETALSVDMNALWRVDLNSHEAQLISPLGTPDPLFSCSALAVSRTGSIRCERGDQLYDIRNGSAQLIGSMPGGVEFVGLAFDADGRLWSMGGHLLHEIDPVTGAVISEKWLGLPVNCYVDSVAANGNQLIAFTHCDSPSRHKLQEIDPETGSSLWEIDLAGLKISNPADGAFDSHGDLWFSQVHGGPVMGIDCYSYNRLRISPLSVEETWWGCFLAWNPPESIFLGIDAIEGASVIEVPTVSPLGALVFVLLLAAAAWFRLRDGRGTDGTPAR